MHANTFEFDGTTWQRDRGTMNSNSGKTTYTTSETFVGADGRMIGHDGGHPLNRWNDPARDWACRTDDRPDGTWSPSGAAASIGSAMPRAAAVFSLAFPAADIHHWAARYAYRDENEAITAGRAIAAGEFTRTNLLKIHRWKTKGRRGSLLARNTDAEIADALTLAVTASTDRAAAAVLCGLVGVKLPVASAILTAIDPERFTIIDFRALEALKASDRYLDLQLYLDYLAFCRALAAESGTSLRTLDKALWQWSAENGSSVAPDEGFRPVSEPSG